MQRIISLLFLIFLFYKVTYADEKITIAVMGLTGEGVSASATRIITSRLRTYLVNTNKFKVVEREKMEDILKEQDFQLSGCTSNECVVEAGMLLGVERIVAGEIGKIGNLFTLSIRMIDVQTGEILKTATEDCECKIETVLTKSVKNVTQILSGQKVQVSSYTKDKSSIKNKNSSNYINEWEILGMTREKYIKLQHYNKAKKGYFFPILASIIPGLYIHGLGHIVAGDYKTGFILLGVESVGYALIPIFPHESKHGHFIEYLEGVLIIGTLLYDVIHTPFYIHNYNVNLEKKYDLSIIPSYDYKNKQIELGLSLRF